MSVWKAGREVVELVDKVREKYHPHLAEANIAVVLNDKTPVSGNKVCVGKMKRTSREDQLLHHHDFKLIVYAGPFAGMSDKEKAALIDHELTHANVERIPRYEIGESGKRTKCRDEYGRVIYTDEVKIDDESGKPKFVLKQHDVETFLDVIERHGLENCPEVTDIRKMRKVFAAKKSEEQAS